MKKEVYDILSELISKDICSLTTEEKADILDRIERVIESNAIKTTLIEENGEQGTPISMLDLIDKHDSRVSVHIIDVPGMSKPDVKAAIESLRETRKKVDQIKDITKTVLAALPILLAL